MNGKQDDPFFKVELYAVKIGATLVFVAFVLMEVVHAIRHLLGW
jgi:hypothetical protein